MKGVWYDRLAKQTPFWKRPKDLASMTLLRDLGESRQSAILEIFHASSYSKNEKDFKLFCYLQGKALLRPRILRQNLQCSQEDHVMQHEEKRRAINAQEIFNQA